VLEIVLNRPKANAIDNATSRLMGELFCQFRDDPALRVAILTGAGERFFCAGWDLNAAADGAAIEGEYGAGGFGGLTELHDLNKPVIAAVNGLAVGGGFELALACDLIVAAENAEFFLPEIFVGIVADAATIRLPRRLPYHIAIELLLTGRRMGAAEAAGWGLVNAVVPASDLLGKARSYADLIVEAAPLSIAAVKELTRAFADKSVAASYDLLQSRTLEMYEKMLHSEDAQEGPRAFAEKRAPRWQGR
ncbi:MAG: crotonobetainyl-CoA hydratase, partial [Anaerolineales bacterium]|nr:crotonobetainyl-CoA hydratase [Anaerolineales bacterium]